MSAVASGGYVGTGPLCSLPRRRGCGGRLLSGAGSPDAAPGTNQPRAVYPQERRARFVVFSACSGREMRLVPVVGHLPMWYSSSRAGDRGRGSNALVQ